MVTKEKFSNICSGLYSQKLNRDQKVVNHKIFTIDGSRLFCRSTKAFLYFSRSKSLKAVAGIIKEKLSSIERAKKWGRSLFSLSPIFSLSFFFSLTKARLAYQRPLYL